MPHIRQTSEHTLSTVSSESTLCEYAPLDSTVVEGGHHEPTLGRAARIHALLAGDSSFYGPRATGAQQLLGRHNQRRSDINHHTQNFASPHNFRAIPTVRCNSIDPDEWIYINSFTVRRPGSAEPYELRTREKREWVMRDLTSLCRPEPRPSSAQREAAKQRLRRWLLHILAYTYQAGDADNDSADSDAETEDGKQLLQLAVLVGLIRRKLRARESDEIFPSQRLLLRFAVVEPAVALGLGPNYVFELLETYAGHQCKQSRLGMCIQHQGTLVKALRRKEQKEWFGKLASNLEGDARAVRIIAPNGTTRRIISEGIGRVLRRHFTLVDQEEMWTTHESYIQLYKYCLKETKFRLAATNTALQMRAGQSEVKYVLAKSGSVGRDYFGYIQRMLFPDRRNLHSFKREDAMIRMNWEQLPWRQP